MNRDYVEQYKRMKRWYQSFKKINYGRDHDKESDYYEDTVYIFFMQCYHLKDWLKESDKVRFSDVEKIFTKNKGIFCMRVCADMCNGIKHMKLKNNRIDKNTKLGSKFIKMCIQEGGSSSGNKNCFYRLIAKIFGRDIDKINLPTVNIRYKISVKNKSYDAFDIATQCMNEWKKYLKGKNAI